MIYSVKSFFYIQDEICVVLSVKFLEVSISVSEKKVELSRIELKSV